jgi:general secretion pathway protein E/type IV pilus assembly protein PilB
MIDGRWIEERIRAPLLGEVLLEMGFVTRRQLTTALDLAHVHNRLLGQSLLELKYIKDTDLRRALSRQRELS